MKRRVSLEMSSSTLVALRRRVVNNFKLQGLSLKSEATSFLVETLEPCARQPDINGIIDQIVEAVQKQPLRSSLVDRASVEAAVEECNSASDSDGEKAAMVVIDAFSVPRFSYNVDQKKFFPVPSGSLRLHEEAGAKATLFREHYALVHQWTLRHELFTPPSLGQPLKKFQLRNVEYLLSSSGIPDEVIVLGMLAQVKEGKFHLEDPTGAVELDLSECTFHTGIFVENSLVLAEGFYDDVFHVSGVGLPPLELASDTRKHFGNINFFGGPLSYCVKSSRKMEYLLEENSGTMFVLVSDVFLDRKEVVDKLATMFAGFSDDPPTAFFFLGNFSSAPYGPLKLKKLAESFRALGELIRDFPNLLRSQFFFVPGPLDPGPGNIVPRPPIPSVLTSGLTERVPGAQFTSNPCRVQFCTREIVLFRDDIMNKMCRHCVHFPSTSRERGGEGGGLAEDMPSHFVKTILSQAHLSPLPLHVRPRFWTHDHALYLYPLPDLVVMGDKCDPYTVRSSECTVTNPGSFMQSGFEFKVYMPGPDTLEESKID